MDRNLYYGDDLTFADGSLSARRAWIEILLVYLALIRYLVALRKESVDRNAHAMPSQEVFRVALRKESVDRNKL